MDFKDVIIEKLSSFTFIEREEIKSAIDKLNDYSELKKTALRIASTEGRIDAFRYVKNKTGWGMAEIITFLEFKTNERK